MQQRGDGKKTNTCGVRDRLISTVASAW